MEVDARETGDTDGPRRIFLSYAREDDIPFVDRLYTDLTAAGFQVWYDRESLLSRGLTFHQEIKDAIRTEVDRIVYVGGPKAAQSAYVREEWQFGLERDSVVVTPILRLGDYDNIPGELALLHCEDFRDDARYPDALRRLIESLRQPNPKLGALCAVPSLPARFLVRAELMCRVRDALLVDLQTPQVITSADARVGMQGMGGIGKSVLAAALARNRDVRAAYPDGIVWVSCGQHLTTDDLIARQRDVVRALGGDDSFTSLSQGQTALRDLLSAKAVLLILDDVWQAADANAFDQLGPRCRMLVTTRDAGILYALHGEGIPVSLLSEAEALDLLADATGMARDALPPEAPEIIRECGCLPLAIALSGGMVKRRSGDSKSVLKRLQNADLDKIADRMSINPQHDSIWRAMQISVEVLTEDEQQRFAELAVFDTDRDVPEAAVATLWAHTGSLDDLDTEDLLINLAERSLVRLEIKPDSDGKPQPRISLHDLLHDYAVRIAGEPKALHQRLIEAYRAKCPDGWSTGPNDSYYLENLCRHLVRIEDWDTLIGDAEQPGVLTDLLFIQAKCEAGGVHDLMRDYNEALAALPEFREEKEGFRRRDEAVYRYNRALRAYAVRRAEWREQCDRGENVSEPDYPAMPAELQSEGKMSIPEERSERAARLRHFANFVSRHLTLLTDYSGDTLCLAGNDAEESPVSSEAESIINAQNQPWLRRLPRPPAPPLRPQCLRTLQGHTSDVRSVCVSPDGRHAVSASNDNTLRVWDLETGACLRTLEGHASGVTSVCVSPDGRRAVSANCDKTLRVWDLKTGECLRTLDGNRRNRGGVNSVSVSADRQHADAGRGDNTSRTWDLETFLLLLALEEHISGVTCICMSPDGRRAVSGSSDFTLRVWDLETGACLRTLEGISGPVTSVCVSPDGRRAVSGNWVPYGCEDNTLRVWDLETGTCLCTLEGHPSTVPCVCVSPDGRHVVSEGRDNTLRVWDLETGGCLRTLEGHASGVTSVCVSPDGRRAVSANCDKTLRVWDLKTGECLRTLEGHNSKVTSVSVSPNGRRAVSGSDDKTLRVWDLETGERLRTLEGHYNEVSIVSVSPDARRAVSGSQGRHGCGDYALRVWDLETGAALRTLEGHSDFAHCVNVSPDGWRAVSGSGDNTLRIWDLKTGLCLHTLKGHDKRVSCVSVSPDGRRVVSGSDDNTLRVWDLETGACMRTLEGHTDMVTSVCVSPDGRRAVSGSCWDKTLRVWDLETGACLRSLEECITDSVDGSVTPDGRLTVSGSWEHTLRVWDLKTGGCLYTLEGHSEWVWRVRVTPDGRCAVSGSQDNTLRFWDLKTGACLRTLEGHSVWVNPDGRRAVSISNDHTLRLWELETGACLAVYHACSAVRSIAIVPTGERIVCGTRDGQMHFLTPVNFPPAGPAIVTAMDSDAARCPLCAREFPPLPHAVAAVRAHTATLGPEQSPCLDLPAAAFDDPALLTTCPHCGGALKFNPFMVEMEK